MIQIATALPVISAGPARPVLLAAQSGTSNFALALSSLLVPGGAVDSEPGEVPLIDAPVAGRQLVAEPGKELPKIVLEANGDDEAPEPDPEADDGAPAGDDLPFAWFALPAAPAPDAAPVAAPVAAPKPVVAEKPRTVIELPEAAISGKPAPARPGSVETAQPVVKSEAPSVSAAQPGTKGEAPSIMATQPAAKGEVPSVSAAQPAVKGEVRSVSAVQPAVKGEAPSVQAAPLVVEGEAAPAPASVSLDATPSIAPLPPRRAERPLAVAPRPELPISAAEAPAAPATAAAPIVAGSAPVAAVAPMPAPAPVQLPAPAVSAGAPAQGTAVSTPGPVAAPAAVTQTPVQPPMAAAVTSAVPQPAPPIAAPAPQPVREAAPAAVEAPAPRAQVADPVASPVRQPAAAPAQPVTVASLIAQASVQSAAAQPISFAPLHRAFREADQPVVTSIAAPGTTALQQVAAAPDAQQGTLDMRRQEWLGKMVETIEAMREAAPVKETRLSLVPDALGKVDISVRQEGDRVHVHIAAETQAARQILTDAQPRLAELAEQRGIRLGQTSIDSGQGGAGAQSGQRQNEAQRPQNPSAPASARAAKDQLTQSDDRVA